MRRQFLQSSFGLLLTLFLTACGGGGGGGDGSLIGPGTAPGTGTTDEVVTPTLTLTVLDANGDATSQVSGNTPVTVRAQLLDSDGVPVEGEIINFTSNVGQLTPASGSILTNAEGIAEIELSAGDEETAGSVSASGSVSGVSVSDSANIQSDGLQTTENPELPPTLELTVLDTDGNVTNQVLGNTPVNVRVLLTTSDGEPIVGELVTFSTEVGQLTPSSGTDLTDADGIATIQLGAGQIATAGRLTATSVVNGETITATTNVQSDGLATTGGINNFNIVLDVEVTDSTPGVPSSIITALEGASVNLIVFDQEEILNAQGEVVGTIDTPIPNIEADITTSLGTINLANEPGSVVLTAVTDSDGAINFELTAGDQLGSGEITVRVRDAEAVAPFEVGVAGLKIGTGSGDGFVEGDIDIGVNPLSAGGTAIISVTVVDSENRIVPGISIDFASTCTASIDGMGGFLATISAASTSNALGVAQATYEALGCEGNDVITATEATSGETASGTIQVFPPAVGNIIFVSVQDAAGNDIESIFFKESGGISTAEVTFQVLDTRGDPVQDQTVEFSLSTAVGGITLEDASGLTDSEGFASAVVNAGFVQTPLTVTATIEFDTDNDNVNDTTRNSQSDLLSVNSGVADYDSFTLSASQLSFEGADRTDRSVTLSVSLADKFNNPVPDGTSVSFRTEYGRITPSCNTVDGDCTATLNGVNPKTPLVGTLKTLDDSSCPSDIVFEEVVPTSTGDTDFLARTIYRVEKNSSPATGSEDDALTLTTDYTVRSDQTGIDCVSVNCSVESALKVTYQRYPDEDNSSNATHVFTNPGAATAPFRSVTTQSTPPCRTAAADQGGSLSSGFNGGLGQLYGIRSSVLAFAQGEESFADVNGNGTYDFGEVFVDLTEVFLDHNEDSVFSTGGSAVADSRDTLVRGCYGPESPITNASQVLGNCFQTGDAESFVDFDSSLTFQKGNGIYNGSLCPREVDERTEFCDNSTTSPCNETTSRYCTRDLVFISRQMVISFSGSEPYYGLIDTTSGEFIQAVELTTTTGTARQLKAGVDVKSNDGSTIAAGTAFTIGHADGEVPPHTGDSVALTAFANTASVALNFSDRFNNSLPSDTSVSTSVGADGCLIDSADSGEIGTDQTVNMFLSTNPDRTSGSSAVTVTFTSPSGSDRSVTFTCSY